MASGKYTAAIFFHAASGKRIIVGAKTHSFDAATRVPSPVIAPEAA
jgi:hypothetical protein